MSEENNNLINAIEMLRIEVEQARADIARVERAVLEVFESMQIQFRNTRIKDETETSSRKLTPVEILCHKYGQ